MPTWTELQLRRRDTSRKTTRIAATEEVLVLDERARMTPGNFIEEKLRAALSIDRRPVRRVPK